MSGGGTGRADPLLAVVVPTLEEARALPRLLSDLAALSLPHDVIVSDGGSRDGTVDIATSAGATVVSSPAGRGAQIRAGVAATEAPWLLILHADCRLDAPAARALEAWLRSAGPSDAAHFRFALEGSGWFWRFLEVGQRLRERLTGLVYGDQGLVLSRSAWDAVGGADDTPLMEDVALVDRLRRHGRVHRLPATLPTSPRRYREEGRWYGWIRNTLLVGLYRLGVPPRRLAPFYRRDAGRAVGGGGADTVVVFARAPRPGSVKTRLAADVGDAAAVRFYRTVGGELVERLRGGPWRLVVAYTPDGAGPEVRSWLGDGPEYLPQRGDTLGGRMANALAEALEVSDRACVVGTDVPDLDRRVVEEALGALDRHDLVVGPAEDGGYYLLGLRRVHPELFRDIPWSTERVLPSTLERAGELDLRVHLLSPLRDVDTVDDVPPRFHTVLDPPGGS